MATGRAVILARRNEKRKRENKNTRLMNARENSREQKVRRGRDKSTSTGEELRNSWGESAPAISPSPSWAPRWALSGVHYIPRRTTRTRPVQIYDASRFVWQASAIRIRVSVTLNPSRRFARPFRGRFEWFSHPNFARFPPRRTKFAGTSVSISSS